MRARHFAALLPAACASAALAAPLEAQPPADPRIRSVIFSPEAVVAVPVRRAMVTHIVLVDDETIVNQPGMGKGSDCSKEEHQWCVAASGRDIFIKAKTGATTNNMVVVTTQRRHAFEFNVLPDELGATAACAPPCIPVGTARRAASRDMQQAVMRLTMLAQPPTPRPFIPALALSPKPLTAKELVENRMRAEPQVRNSDYSVAVGRESDDIVPVMVYDNGTMTFMAFPNNRPIPAVFQTGSDQSEEMVTARMNEEGDQLVIDRVARRFVLRLGTRVVSVINEAFDIDGVPPKGGTTVPGVVRTLRTASPVQGASR